VTWVLVLVAVLETGVLASQEGEFKYMEDCFWARERLIERLNPGESNPPIGTQLVCIRKNDSQ
jgi:hypothetical protein